jgi:uncharacterized protein YbaP (TraB family)
VEQALGDADLLLVEIADLNNDGATRAVYNRLAHSPGQPPIDTRLPAAQRPALAQLMAKGGLKSDSFSDTETWAAALMLGHVAQGPDEDAGNGVDRALLSSTHLPVGELEGAQKQLGLFDSLPETAQRAMLSSVVVDAPHAEEDTRQLAQAWRNGDMDWIARRPARACWPTRPCAMCCTCAATATGAKRLPGPSRRAGIPSSPWARHIWPGLRGCPPYWPRGFRVTRVE